MLVKTRIRLRDIEGDNPKFQFDEILKGAEAFYDSALLSCQSWLPPLKGVNLDFEKSNFFRDVIQLKDYVCNQTYRVDIKDECILDDWKETKHWPDKRPPHLSDQLIANVTTVYDLWKSELASISMIFDEISKEERLFSLFAQAAKLRFQVDFGHLSEFRASGENFEDNCYFTRNELGLLASIVFTDRGASDIMHKNNLKELPTTHKMNDIHIKLLPDHPEFDHYSKGRISGNSATIVKYDDALSWLGREEVPFFFTKYIHPG
jgi:hypothetical protein